VNEVPLAAPLQPGFGVRTGLGYGFTESVLHDGEAHHRSQLDVAASLVGSPWLAAALRLVGRYDLQTGGAESGDYGVITEAQLRGRALLPPLAANLRAGAELALWFPSADTLANSPRALSGDLQLFTTYLPDHSPLALGLALGLRIDRSKFSGGDPNQYSAADRLALGISDGLLAVRMGLAATYRIGRFALVSEWSWKMYLAYPGQSPMWISAGLRYSPSAAWQLEALLGVSPSARPPLAAVQSTPLVRIEPRFSAGISAALAFPWESAVPSVRAAPARAETVQATPTTAVVRGHVSTPAALGVAGARVTVETDDQARSAECDAEGFFTFADLPAGTYRMRVSAKGWMIPERTVELGPGENEAIEVTLKRELPKGQIRGTVHSFDGKPLDATVLIPALGLQQTTGNSGAFELDVPPGEYDVLVRVPGFSEQKRRARVELHEVAILIMELQPKPPAPRSR
jgi:hypothetical protein